MQVSCVRVAPPAKPRTVRVALPRRSARRGGAPPAASDVLPTELAHERVAYVRRECFFVDALAGWLSVYEQRQDRPLSAATPLVAGGAVLPAPYDASLLVGDAVLLMLAAEGAARAFDAAAYRALLSAERASPCLDRPHDAPAADVRPESGESDTEDEASEPAAAAAESAAEEESVAADSEDSFSDDASDASDYARDPAPALIEDE